MKATNSWRLNGKSTLLPRSGSTAFSQLKPIHKKGAIKFKALMYLQLTFMLLLHSVRLL